MKFTRPHGFSYVKLIKQTKDIEVPNAHTVQCLCEGICMHRREGCFYRIYSARAPPKSPSTKDEAVLSPHSAEIFPHLFVLWFIYEYKRLGHSMDIHSSTMVGVATTVTSNILWDPREGFDDLGSQIVFPARNQSSIAIAVPRCFLLDTIYRTETEETSFPEFSIKTYPFKDCLSPSINVGQMSPSSPEFAPDRFAVRCIPTAFAETLFCSIYYSGCLS